MVDVVAAEISWCVLLVVMRVSKSFLRQMAMILGSRSKGLPSRFAIRIGMITRLVISMADLRVINCRLRSNYNGI